MEIVLMRNLLILSCFLFAFNAHALEGDNYSDLSTFPKWVKVLHDQPLPKIHYKKVSLDQLKAINIKDNEAISFKSDNENDWQTPSKSLKLKTGNCKDYAILKFYDLIAAGVHPEDMLIVVGNYKHPNGVKELHAVLQVNLDDQLYILDSITNEPVKAETYYKTSFPDVAYGINNTHWTRKPLEDK